jgi:uncharacterized protein YggT (Ycf19 family)
MNDNKLEVDEMQRAANYEAVKSNVESRVGGEIVAEANSDLHRESDAIDSVAERMRERAVADVVETERDVERGRVVARISQVVDYVFLLIYGFLTIRLLLELLAARESAGFFKFIRAVTDPFYSPFRGLVPSPSTAEGFTLALPIIVAIVVYMLLHLAINGFLRILAHRKVAI